MPPSGADRTFNVDGVKVICQTLGNVVANCDMEFVNCDISKLTLNGIVMLRGCTVSTGIEVPAGSVLINMGSFINGEVTGDGEYIIRCGGESEE